MNPFEDENSTYLVLINDENQHSLWPSFLRTPDGWKVVYGPENRKNCLNTIQMQWTDMRPTSVALAMQKTKVKAQLE